MKNNLVQQCLNILKREDIKYEFKCLCAPLIELVFYEINPYIYIIIGITFLMFIMILAILILLILILRNKNLVLKI